MFLLSYHQIKDDSDLESLLSNMIQFTGIFSALLITLLISKVFQIRQEKLSLLRKAEILSNKVMDLQRIAFRLVESYGFWESSMRKHMDNNYPDLDKCVLREGMLNKNHPSYELIQIFHSEFMKSGTDNPEVSSYFHGSDLYFDLKALVNNDTYMGSPIYNDYDWNEIYSQPLIQKWEDYKCGNFWPYFSDVKWRSYDRTFHFNEISSDKQTKILTAIVKINPKYKGRKLDNKLLNEIGGEFTGFYIPMLNRHLKILEEKLPYILKILLRVLSIALISGLFIPIIISATKFDELSNPIALTYLSLMFLIGSVAFFLINLKSMLERVLDISDISKSVHDHKGIEFV